MKTGKLFVGNLNFEASREQVFALFSEFGEVRNIRMRRGKGFAFVEMANPAAAESAAGQLNRQLFQGRELRICEEVSSRKAAARTREEYKLKRSRRKGKKQEDKRQGWSKSSSSGGRERKNGSAMGKKRRARGGTGRSGRKAGTKWEALRKNIRQAFTRSDSESCPRNS